MDNYTKKIYVGYEQFEDGHPSNIGWLDEEYYNQWKQAVLKNPTRYGNFLSMGLPANFNTVIFIAAITPHMSLEDEDLHRNIADEVTEWLIVRGSIPPEMRDYGRKPRGNEWFTPAGSDEIE